MIWVNFISIVHHLLPLIICIFQLTLSFILQLFDLIIELVDFDLRFHELVDEKFIVFFNLFGKHCILVFRAIRVFYWFKLRLWGTIINLYVNVSVTFLWCHDRRRCKDKRLLSPYYLEVFTICWFFWFNHIIFWIAVRGLTMEAKEILIVLVSWQAMIRSPCCFIRSQHIHSRPLQLFRIED